MNTRWGYLTAIIIVIVIVILVVMAYRSGLNGNSDSGVSIMNIETGPDRPDLLNGRMVVWSTDANVPAEISMDENENDPDSAGTGDGAFPFDLNIGRDRVRDEWNVAAYQFGLGSRMDTLAYLTENSGTYTHPDPGGAYVVATVTRDGSQDIARISIETGEVEVIAYSHSIDRWPSITADGSNVIFHSFRDQNPAGDLYLAHEPSAEGFEWDIIRLTDSSEYEYIWPEISDSGTFVVAFERRIGEESGRVIRWELVDDQLTNAEYCYEEPRDVQFPTVCDRGWLVSWQENVDGLWKIALVNLVTGTFEYLGPDENYDGPGWIQPGIAPDGKFVVFVADTEEYGDDRIGIFDLTERNVVYLPDPEGTVMFPAMTGREE